MVLLLANTQWYQPVSRELICAKAMYKVKKRGGGGGGVVAGFVASNG